MMTDPRLDKLIGGLQKLVDEIEPGVHRHGPMRMRFLSPPKDKEAPWRVEIEAGWDSNYGGRIVIESSKTGKALRAYAIPDEYGTPRIFRGDKEL